MTTEAWPLVDRGREGAGERTGLHSIALLAILATVSMLFAAFTAGLLVRRTGPDWVPVPLPPAAWLNAIFLVASSATLEMSRLALRRDDARGAVAALGITAILGVAFLGGQLFVWSQLVRQGVFLPTSPHAAFFYLLSAVHAAHLLGGLGALAWGVRGAKSGRYTATDQRGLTHISIYWHVVGAIWLYLLVLLTAL